MVQGWESYTNRSLKRALKGSLIGLLAVPLFHVVLNTNFSHPEYIDGLFRSMRIGATVVVVNLSLFFAVYTYIYRSQSVFFLRMKDSVQFRFGLGFLGMAVGMLVASQVELRFGNQALNLQGFAAGLLIGGITYLAFVLRSAYRESKEFNLQLRAESAENYLHVLKNQMQPHFLFNSLNSLAELIDSNRDTASHMTQKLSDLYREILESSKKQLSSVDAEISIVRKYLDLESLRFGPRLQYEIKVPKESQQIQIPSLLLQTLVENSVKHGVSQSLTGGLVKLEILPSGKNYFAQITNTSGGKSAGIKSTGTGLRNTISRLDLLYGDLHQFSYESGDSQTRVAFYFPGGPR